VLQPVVVRPLPGERFELVAGERRWRAAQVAGLLKIPALVKDVPEERVLEFALVENLQREELNPIEEAQAYDALARDYRLTQQEIADRTGRNRATVANTMRLLGLPGPVQERVKSGSLSMGHARALLSLPQAVEQVELAERIVRDGLSVRETERVVNRLLQPASPAPAARPSLTRDPNVVAAEEELQRELGAKIRIFVGRQGAGRIEIRCFSEEELDRVYELLLEAARRRPRGDTAPPSA
jgi:ParB family chromosome partitioning protein